MATPPLVLGWIAFIRFIQYKNASFEQNIAECNAI